MGETAVLSRENALAERVFSGLNDAQREAVESTRGAVCILAGAGTGKTTTITRRIAWQVGSGEFDAGQILAVTFTQKAAREMGDRLGRLGASGVRAMTFHAEALGQFRRFSPHQPDILSHKGQILHQIAQRLPMPHRFTALRDLAGEIEWAKNRRLSARDYLSGIHGHEPPLPPELMQRVYVEYEKRKRRAGMIDFEDLLERTVEILATDERALALVRGRYHAFTVDEYQDVNLLQQTLLDQWVGARGDVCVVGDDYQSIFGFTGASASYLLRFPQRFDQCTVVTLTENHRSTPEILTVANRLVPRMGGSRKQLRAVRASGPAPQLRDFDSGPDEVGFIVDACRTHHDDGMQWEDMAVLFRINGRSEDFEEAFARAGIPYQVRDGSFLARPAARAFLARVRRAPEDLAAAGAEQIARELGYDARGKYEAGDEATRQADLERLQQLARELQAARDDATLQDFVEDVRARFATEEQGRGVQLMTYHRAKGLEFDAVFLPRLEDKEMPFALSTSAEDIAEERRLFYVGITRAKRYLSLSYARSREGERRSKPRRSPFADEILPPPARADVVARDRAAASEARERKRVPDGPPDPLLDALKAWRLDVAKRAGLPAYVVFHDSTLQQIAQQKPGSHAELRAIPGVGAIKMQRYGDDLLAVLARDI